MHVCLVNYTPDPLMTIEKAASQCYQSEPNPKGRITRACYLSGHHSVLEHVSFTFEVDGVSRALLAQLTRHRLASFSVKSQRYVDEGNFEYVIPLAANQKGGLGDYCLLMHEVRDLYRRLRDEYGWDAEDARMILPNACCTTLTVTMNLRELVHFCNERMCNRAQWEIRELAYKMAKAVNEATNNAFSYMLVPHCEKIPDFPFCPEGTKCCGKHKTLKEVYHVG